MPLPGDGAYSRNAAPTLEISPDSPLLIVYGGPSEAQNAELTGKIILNNPESMFVKGIEIKLMGMREVSLPPTETETLQSLSQNHTFFLENLNIFPVDGSKRTLYKINAGVYRWGFKFTIPGDLDESVEGLLKNWIKYSLEAKLDRGYINLLESSPVEQIHEGIWPSRLVYKIFNPQENYVVGTSIRIDIMLIPLQKGLEIANIKLELVESQQLFYEYAGRRMSHTTDARVAVKEGNMLDCSEDILVPQDIESGDQLFDESHRFSILLDLPKSLKQCRQSVNTENIRISHKLRLYVNLCRSGHKSQLLVKNHIHLFISPNLPPREDQSIVVNHSMLSRQQDPPPTYDRHQLDALCSDRDLGVLLTPGCHAGMANSSSDTAIYSRSHSGRTENSSPDAITGGPSDTTLPNRIQDLIMNQNGRNSRSVSPMHHSSGNSIQHSLPDDVNYVSSTTYFVGWDNNMEILARRSSYNTNRPTLARTPSPENLPIYEIASSGPFSLGRSQRLTSTTTRSLDSLTEEEQRNTEINDQRESPRPSGDRQ